MSGDNTDPENVDDTGGPEFELTEEQTTQATRVVGADNIEQCIIESFPEVVTQEQWIRLFRGS